MAAWVASCTACKAWALVGSAASRASMMQCTMLLPGRLWQDPSASCSARLARWDTSSSGVAEHAERACCGQAACSKHTGRHKTVQNGGCWIAACLRPLHRDLLVLGLEGFAC